MNNLKIITLIFTVLFCLMQNKTVMAQTDTLSFLHVSDLHIIFNQDGYHPDMMAYRATKKYHLGEIRFRNFLQNVPQITNSQMVIATGDMVDFFEGSTRNNKLLDGQPEQFAQLLNDYNIPVLLTMGNHDAFTFYWEKNKLHATQDYSGRARATWIRNIQCFKNGSYYCKKYQVGKTAYRLIFLDDILFRFKDDDDKTEIPHLDKEQLYWLKTQLNESDNDIEIILMHIPFDKIGEEARNNEFYSLLDSTPSTKLILAGHHHKSEITKIPCCKNHQLIQVQTGSLVKTPENWRQIKLTENNIWVSFPGEIKNELIIPIK
jgi:3',5'-cyclic AMP phosphodiesterase CpdA